VFYDGERADGVSLFSKPSAGGDEFEVSRQVPATAEMSDCSATHCVMGAWRPEAGTNFDLLSVRLSDGAVQPFAATPADENDARISPDGRFVAYVVNMGGRDEVFVRPFPSGSGQWQLSAGGGEAPSWSRDGRTLYFLTASDIVALPIATASGFSPGTPRVIASRKVGSPGAPLEISGAQVTPDGRILAAVSRATSAATYRLVLNWR
jgi:dipeptidyl aminopeptidase/acylaminoacyl peptidase